MSFQCFTLQHHKLMSKQEWEALVAPKAIKAKGFYVYRGRRLIIAGSWLGLAEGAECLQRMSADAFAPALIDAGCRRAGLCVPDPAADASV